jgi:hypothetical protein
MIRFALKRSANMRGWKRTLSITVFAIAAFQLHAGSEIRVIDATYGDSRAKKSCKPDLSICKGRTICEFVVDDGLCAVDAAVKNLEVMWDCGPGTQKKSRAAAKGTKMSLSCAH